MPERGGRDAVTVQDVDYSWFAFGYRRAFQAPYDAQAAFDAYVEK
ncbi:hypothetical protein ACHMWU_01355 [Aeromicrobium sp. UC242_57]